MARVRLFAGAAEAFGADELQVEAATAGELRRELVAGHAADVDHAGRVITRCSLLVDGVRAAEDDCPLRTDSLVDVLPPFAGG